MDTRTVRSRQGFSLDALMLVETLRGDAAREMIRATSKRIKTNANARILELLTPGWTPPGEKRLRVLRHAEIAAEGAMSYFAELAGRKSPIVPDIRMASLGRNQGKYLDGWDTFYLSPSLAYLPPYLTTETTAHEGAHLARSTYVPSDNLFPRELLHRFIGTALEEGIADYLAYAYLSRNRADRWENIVNAFVARYKRGFIETVQGLGRAADEEAADGSSNAVSRYMNKLMQEQPLNVKYVLGGVLALAILEHNYGSDIEAAGEGMLTKTRKQLLKDLHAVLR